MSRLSCVAMALCAALLALGAPAAEGLGENRRNPGWRVTEDAQKYLAELAEKGKAWKPHTPSIRLFCRNQMKYGANRSDYLHKWYERPLYQNTAWQVADDPDVLVNPLAWNEETIRFARAGKLDGFAACPTQIGREWLIPRSVQKGGEITAYLELPYGYHEGSLDLYMKVAEMAYRMPNAFRIDGKIVLTRYPTVNLKELDRAEEFRTALDAKYGPDKFIVLYYVKVFEGGIPDHALTVKDIDKSLAYLREVLRKTDGIFYAGWDVFWPRRYDEKFETEVLTPIFRSVLAEPEFGGRKYLGMPMCQGHANCYRWGYSLDSNATQMFVDRMLAMEKLQPDFTLACEWDEENENTHFRPTVSSGTTNMRINRYFADRFAGRKPTPWPEDRDFTRPNLILSYRKSLVAGEPAEVEVRNVPDGSFAGETFAVSFRWRLANGKIVEEFEPQSLSADDIGSVRFVTRASRLADYRAVIPELTVKTMKGEQVFSKGLWPLDVHATRWVDSWWIKTPLRDLGEVDGSLVCRGRDATGAYTIAGKVASKAKLRSIEVLEGPDTVFMAESAADHREVRERFIIDIQGQIDCQRFVPPVAPCHLDGTVEVKGAPHAKLSEPSRFTTPGAKAIEPWKVITLKDKTYTFKGASINRIVPYVLAIELPNGEVENATIEVNLESFSGTIRLKDILEKGALSLVGPCGGNFAVRRGLTQGAIPKALDITSGEFSFKMLPLDRCSVLRLQTVDENLHVWRSEPFQFFREPVGEKAVFRVFERDEEKVSECAVDRSLLPSEIRYDFSDTGRGGVIPAVGLGRAYWGILGGFCPQVNGIGRGESDYGNSLGYHFSTNTPGFMDTAPARAVGPDGSAAFAFKNANHISFPQQIVPTFAAWEVGMDVCPDSEKGTGVLFGAGACAYKMRLVNGVPTLEYFSAVGYATRRGAVVRAEGPKLTAGKWHRLRFVCDQRNLWVETDGVAGRKIPFSGYMHQQRYTEMGSGNHDLRFFRGKIANLTIRIPEAEDVRKPYTHLDFQNDPDDFRFAIVPDRAGGDYRGAFTNALAKVNMMHPEFVMTVGDLIGGYDDPFYLHRQMRELTNMTAKVRAPFFSVVGNHDIVRSEKKGKFRRGQEVSSEVWKSYNGSDTWYAFVYKNCLFACLDTMSGLDTRTPQVFITEEQDAWFRRVLDEHRDVRWTFIFMHMPYAWTKPQWTDLEATALKGRKYTVFAGDWHTYLHAKRNGMDHYVLSVAGGCSAEGYTHDRATMDRLRGLAYGEMDHITWVTMTKDGPSVVNLTLEGILPGDYLNQRTTKSTTGMCRLDSPDPSEKRAAPRPAPAGTEPCRLPGARLEGATDRDALSYRVGEKIVFSLRLEGVTNAVPAGCRVKWEMADDDGRQLSGEADLPIDKPLVLSDTLRKPGFVRLFAHVVDAKGEKVQNGLKKAWDSVAPISFEGGAAAEPEKIAGWPEPADFDGFWNRRRAQLATVPLKFTKTACASTNPAVRVFAVSVDCAGPRPATGFLTVPADASEAKRYPVHLTFEGYGERRPSQPNDGPRGEIKMTLNAFGYELLGKDKSYYESFFKALRIGGKAYAQSAAEHADPANCHFGGMTWRVMRALDFLKAMPEWDGENLRVSGGSQAGLQSLWAAALDPAVTRADIAFPWCCDMGAQAKLRGAKKTWGVEWTEAMGYYDPVNFAKRICCPVSISRAGLGDYTCPPSGIAALWNSLTCRKSIVWMQNSTHEKAPKGAQTWTWKADAPTSVKVRIKPEDNGRALRNPDMGWVMHYYDNGAKYGTFLAPGDSLAWFPGCNVVYLRLPWSWLEPEEGKFNWNAIDTPAQQWIARGGQIAFRITVSETMREGATPAWVARAGAKTIRWNWPTGRAADGAFWECVPDDPVFLEKYGNFLKAFAARYDGRPEVAFVDIGSVGIWGEGHTGRTIQLSPEETQRIVKLHIDLHRKHIRKSLLVANDDFTCSHSAQTSEAMDYARKLGLGWRDDSIMVDSPRQKGWDYYYHAPQALAFAEHAPTILEIGHYSYLKRQNNWSEATLLKSIEDHRAAYLSIHGDPREMLDENPEAVRKSNLRLGYRFQAREIEYPSVLVATADATRARPFDVRFAFANAGADRCRREAFPCLTLKNARGGIVAVLTDADFDLRALETAAPGEAKAVSHVATFALGRWQAPVTPPGEYDVFLSVGRADGTPVYELPMEGEDGARRYRLGTVRVVSGEAVAKPPFSLGRAALCRGRGRDGARPSRGFATVSGEYR